ncbi:hypothetical protein GH15_104 [Staphylococcus phage phiSA039]|uniref:Virion component n=10 Tax=Kayvirus TaxID=1857843 RepID=A0A3T0IDE4_9CAUD|nr:virion structural protein [Staphylococcus phage G15]YP_009098029.1 virion structural protein [Staphylococcus phage MCE-2014]YP_009099561.1 virion structural protein [Staphylococcus phage P108]ARQ96077.1 hypothetical protein qdsa002_120 [Staphylococcus phage qdsa002]AUG85528.1 hypothetical protein HSA30_gp024 [Staphylococcus phage HSA30]AUV57024.1 hypothetical protein LM12_0126 [Staphylococcus phage vB_SauM_LM12]AXU40052.1 hypothetical protein VBSavMJYL01_50 [Staphylococcus phage VB_SavM_JY
MSQDKLRAIYTEMKVELHKFPKEVDVTSKSTAIAINQILDKFKTLTEQAGKITRKYLEGQEILTIDYEYYDSLQEYYIYLLRNSEKIEQSLQEITKRTGEYVK